MFRLREGIETEECCKVFASTCFKSAQEAIDSSFRGFAKVLLQTDPSSFLPGESP